MDVVFLHVDLLAIPIIPRLYTHLLSTYYNLHLHFLLTSPTN